MLTPNIPWKEKQPNVVNYLRPTAFRFTIQKLPNVTYFSQSVNIPRVSLGVSTFFTPMVDIPIPGEKVTFAPLSVEFIIQEDMTNYNELWNWIVNLGSPETKENFSREFGRGKRKTDRLEFSDATLLVLGSDNVPISTVNFIDVFPVSIEALNFDSTKTSDGMNYFMGVAEFRYRSFTITPLSNAL
jgi:hypothetical protein